MTITPWYHVMGLVGILTAFVTGRTAVYLPKFDVDTYLKAVEKYRVSYLLEVQGQGILASETDECTKKCANVTWEPK